MKKYLLLVFIAILSLNIANAQSPYSLSPDWYFGTGGRLTFPTGSFAVSGAPTPGSMPTNTAYSVETSTGICFSSGAVAVYSNTMKAYNANPANASWTDFIRDFYTFGDNVCAGSSTGGGVAFPDPASPTNAFYLILANDISGGNCQFSGVNRYRFTGTGTSVAYNAGPTLIAPNAFAGEAITLGTDGTGGYWVVVHDKSSSNIFRVWHYTASGISAPVDYDLADFFTPADAQSYLKFSPCQDKIAFVGGNALTVYPFNRTTGVISAETQRVAGIGGGDGLEFSPSGNRIFYSGLGTTVSYVDYPSGSPQTVAGSNSWTMQLGPDGKIYTSPSGSNLGVISTPDGTPTYSTLALPGGASLYRGLTNIGWLSPGVPAITATATATCNVYNFSFSFKDYFGSNIGVNVPTVTWSWGDASANTTNNVAPSHTFPAASGGPYTVTLTFNDASCGHTWTATVPVTVTCPAPVELISFTGIGNPSGTDLIWKTAMELNNEFFDLQRSFDGVNFASIAHIPGAGNSNSVITYPYRDTEVTSGLAYYRLIQHDKDGTQASSKIIAVHFDKPSGAPVLIAPNPFSSSFVVSKIYDEEASITVYDIYGRILEQKITTAEESTVSLGESLANGSYIVQYLTGSNAYTIHVEKK